MKYYIFRYRDAMKARGVKFDYTEADKRLFYKLFEEIGSEKAFVQQVEQYDKNSVVLSKEDILEIEKEMNVLHGDFREKGKAIPDDSVNLVFTDPPYGSEYLDLWEPLGELANRVLVPGGFLVAYAGQWALPQKISALNRHVNYYWTFALKFKERNEIFARNIFNYWKPLLVYYKPPLRDSPIWIDDFVLSTKKEKNYHPWQQNEEDIHELIEFFCPPDGVVLDPMAGSGTTLVAAKKLGRQYIGIELEQENLPKIAERLMSC